MMEPNVSKTAFPCEGNQTKGLSKLEYAAITIAASMASYNTGVWYSEEIPKAAVRLARKVLEEVNGN